MTITGLVHVNVNCSDFDRSKAFYEMLGFRHALDVPPTNTAEVAAAVVVGGGGGGSLPLEIREFPLKTWDPDTRLIP